MITRSIDLKPAIRRFKRWHHIFFVAFLLMITSYYITIQYPGKELEQIPFTIGYISGRIFLIAIVSSCCALVTGFILGLLKTVPVFHWFNQIIEAFFQYPPLLYAFIFFMLTKEHSILSIITVFSLLQIYPVVQTTSLEFDKLNREEYIMELKALGISPLKIVLVHILPEAMTSLFLAFLNSVLWIIQAELLLTVTGLVTLYPQEHSLGYLLFESLQQKDPLLVSILLLYFTLFYVELKYMFTVLRFHFEQRKHQRLFPR